MKLRSPSIPMVCALALAGLAAQSAVALPLGDRLDGAQLQAAPLAWELAQSGVDFNGIVALDNCSGSIVRFTSSKPQDQALVLTNGHCNEGGFMTAGQVIVGKASSRTFALLSPDAASTLATLTADQIVYATMTDTDVTYYRLTTTYSELESQYQIHALTIIDHHPEAGSPIRVVSGYWKKIYACTIDAFVFELKEGDWTFKDSLRYKQPGCETIGGTSGSPVIDADTLAVVGINNTHNTSGESCTLDNPCEVDANGAVTATQRATYGQELYGIYSCLTPANQVDLTIAGCTLPKPQSL